MTMSQSSSVRPGWKRWLAFFLTLAIGIPLWGLLWGEDANGAEPTAPAQVARVATVDL